MPREKGFKYVYSVGHLTDVLQKIQETGRPDKLTFAYMRDTWLLKNAQYSAVLDLLTDLGFLDSSGVPTSTYAEYQNPAIAKRTLAQAIKTGYPDLYRAYPNAHYLPKETLAGYVKQQTGADTSVLDKIVATFTKLCSLADFSSDTEPSDAIAQQPEQKAIKTTGTLIPITMNIQIVIPSDATAEQYDMIFSSIKRFLTKQE